MYGTRSGGRGGTEKYVLLATLQGAFPFLANSYSPKCDFHTLQDMIFGSGFNKCDSILQHNLTCMRSLNMTLFPSKMWVWAEDSTSMITSSYTILHSCIIQLQQEVPMK